MVTSTWCFSKTGCIKRQSFRIYITAAQKN